MNIYILEDELYHQTRLQEVLAEIAKQLGVPMTIQMVTGKPDELLENITTFGREQLYFLDIELKGQEKKGLEVAQKIREKDNEATIVFVTTHSEFAAITYRYKVAALDFVDKEKETTDFTKDILSSIQFVLERNESMDSEDVFEIQTQQRHIRVPFQEIYYIETSQTAHKLILWTDRQRIEFYESMKEIEAMEPRFFRAHKAFLINPNKVKEIDRQENLVHFSNGMTSLISRRKVKALEDLIKLKK
ncbi:LytR/AlgR family response regulator transcription factor [Streptococcus moroccensis]|uniref:Two-component system response regulator AgrA n=1 Tax=Streptococcus moroccensis TaxID=1451356 RepID=A0ABT9YNH2_9STRE|nr:LytTR family DNA-binding domain-containing protein [Streptococcus moroccensis]MDQ0221544.1 two-component system response regulator AgrA [Streptococcus moroccensis]